jgi:hypothetical protein
LQALNANQGNRKKTARQLNISYRSLLYKVKDAEIPRKGSHGNSLTDSAANSIMKPRGLGHEPPKP